MRETIIWISVLILFITGIIVSWNLTAYRDVDLLRKKAPTFVSHLGFKDVSYHGYEGGYFMGGYMWFQARDNDGYLYEMAVAEWRGELHIYNLKCLNAVTN